MTHRYVLALDQGTTSSRAILFDRRGQPVAVEAKEFRQIFPRPGWVEHDPLEIWESQLGTARAVLAKARVRADQLAGIGITNQRETAVVWDRRTGEPVANAIVWQDRRTSEMCEDLARRGLGDMFRERTGLVLDPYFSGTKIAWFLEHVPGLRGRAERGEVLFGTIDTWLVWNLSGGRAHLTDYSNASRTLLFDIRRMDWDDALLAALGVPRAMLPEARPSSGVVGTVRAELVGGTAEAPEIPIGGIAGDQQAALFGQACFRPGMAKNTYGTGCFMLMHTGERPVASRHGLLTTVAWGLGGRVEYALEGSVFIAGAAVQWLRDGLGIINRAAETEALARSVADTGGVYLVPAFAGLGAPRWDPYARGTIVGLTRGTGRAELARAALEAIAYQSRDVLDAMQADAGIELQELRVDGGAVANDFLMQFQADMLGVPVDRPAVNETTALGAAYLAGLAVGFWRDRAEVEALWQRDRRFEPAMDEVRRKTLYAGWRRAVERARGWDAPADQSNAAGSAHGPGGERA